MDLAMRTVSANADESKRKPSDLKRPPLELHGSVAAIVLIAPSVLSSRLSPHPVVPVVVFALMIVVLHLLARRARTKPFTRTDGISFGLVALVSAIATSASWNCLVTDVHVINHNNEPCSLAIDGRLAPAVTGVRWVAEGNLDLVVVCAARHYHYTAPVRGRDSLYIDISRVLADGAIHVEKLK